MMEAKINDFVRTDKGFIYKFTEEIKKDIQMQESILWNKGKAVDCNSNISNLVQIRRLCKWL